MMCVSRVSSSPFSLSARLFAPLLVLSLLCLTALTPLTVSGHQVIPWELFMKDPNGLLLVNLSSSMGHVHHGHSIAVPTQPSSWYVRRWYWMGGSGVDGDRMMVEPKLFRTYDDTCSPGSRQFTHFGMRSDGTMMVFGGYVDYNSALRPSNDLLLYSKLSNQWRREFGNSTDAAATIYTVPNTLNVGTRLVASSNVNPGYRSAGASSVDQTTDDFYMYGGTVYPASTITNQLWVYRKTLQQW